ncbi:MerR family transcriptional regulator [Corynebacterium bovis]|uniref:MerR family transcriptional regulator n=1 Tax=Corynebacterium bovis TaxID=36808 RepID=UPI000F649DAC|nr:MerR family transcriptional regulator [Corynebacterium bovis]RRQ14173.1 MerR family transcriptional regulator [Corynebacterium bovis]
MSTATTSVPEVSHNHAAGTGTQGSLFELPVTGDETQAVGYNAPTVAQIAGITYRQLDYWTRTGLIAASITPAAGSGTRRLYSFRDILIIKIIASLLETGLSLKAVRTALDTLTGLGVDDLAATTLFSDGTTIYHCRSSDEIIDLLAGGQGVFGVAVPGLVKDLTATITTLPTHNPAANVGAEAPGRGEVRPRSVTRVA